jgi:hypothetical protein
MKSMKETVEEALALLLHGAAYKPMADHATIETKDTPLRHTVEAQLPQTSLHQRSGTHTDPAKWRTT